MTTQSLLSSLPPPPAPAVELLEVLALRQRLLRAVAFGVAGVGLLATLLLPGLVPSRPLVGAAIGVAASLLALAAVVAADAGDAVVRGPRHVRAAGGNVSMVVPASDRRAAVDAVAEMISDRAVDGARLRVAVTPVSESVGGWVDALAMAVAARGPRTVLADLTLPGDPARDGVAEVAAGDARLADSVRFDESLMLARIGPGRERALGLRALPGFVARMPKDVEVLLVALPGIRHPGVSTALGAVPDSVLLVTAGSTSRVDLMAALETVPASGTRCDIVLRDENARPDRPQGRQGSSGFRILPADRGTSSGGGGAEPSRLPSPVPVDHGDAAGTARDGRGEHGGQPARDHDRVPPPGAESQTDLGDTARHRTLGTGSLLDQRPGRAFDDDPVLETGRGGLLDSSVAVDDTPVPSVGRGDGGDVGRADGGGVAGGDVGRGGGGGAGRNAGHDSGRDDRPDEILRVEAALQALSEQVWQVEERGPA